VRWPPLDKEADGHADCDARIDIENSSNALLIWKKRYHLLQKDRVMKAAEWTDGEKITQKLGFRMAASEKLFLWS
jgi:hypothetical protein